MASLVFCSSFGLLVNQHYCRNELKHASLYAPAKACHAASMANCPMHAPQEKEPKGCCDDQSQYLKHKQEQVQITVELPTAPSDIWLAGINALPPSLLPGINKSIAPYLNYKPPLLVCDLPVSLQAFLL